MRAVQRRLDVNPEYSTKDGQLGLAADYFKEATVSSSTVTNYNNSIGKVDSVQGRLSDLLVMAQRTNGIRLVPRSECRIHDSESYMTGHGRRCAWMPEPCH